MKINEFIQKPKELNQTSPVGSKPIKQSGKAAAEEVKDALRGIKD